MISLNRKALHANKNASNRSDLYILNLANKLDLLLNVAENLSQSGSILFVIGELKCIEHKKGPGFYEITAYFFWF